MKGKRGAYFSFWKKREDGRELGRKKKEKAEGSRENRGFRLYASMEVYFLAFLSSFEREVSLKKMRAVESWRKGERS